MAPFLTWAQPESQMKDYSSAAAPAAAPADLAASNAAVVDEDDSDDPATGSAAYAYWAANVGSADNQSFGLGHSFEERVVDCYCYYCCCSRKSGELAPEVELLRNRRPGVRARRKRTAAPAMASARASVGGESRVEL